MTVSLQLPWRCAIRTPCAQTGPTIGLFYATGGREGTTTKERDLSCKTDDSHLDETTPEPWPCLAVCKWTGITYPALSSDIFSHASSPFCDAAAGGRRAWRCGVVQPTNNQVSNVTALSDQRMAGQHVNIVVGTVGSEGRYMYSYLTFYLLRGSCLW